MSKQPTSRRQRIRVRVLTGSLVVLLAGTVTFFDNALDLCDRIGWCPVGAPAAATENKPAEPERGKTGSMNQISTPVDASRIPHDIEAEGSAAPPAVGTELWLFVEAKGAGRFYPGPGPMVIDAKGRWAQNLHVGGADDTTGARYALHLVSLDPAAAAKVAAYRKAEETTGKIMGMTAAEFIALHPLALDDHSATRQ